MDKTKKIIVSLSIALVVIVIVNYAIITSNNSNYILIPVFKQNLLKGSEINSEDITYIEVKKSKENEMLLKNSLNIDFKEKVLREDVTLGEVVTDAKFIHKDQVLQSDMNYKYISIPVSNLSYPTCNKLKKGDKVTIYYTAKNKAVSNAIKDKLRLYSNSDAEGMVTCLLFETVEVISMHDSTGKETRENVITDILVRLNTQDAILVANLKSQGEFDIVLN